MNKISGRGLIEVVFSIAAIFIILGLFAGEWFVNLKEARKVTLKNELTNIRYSLELYRILEGGYPEDLKALNKKCTVGLGDSVYNRRYLELITQDEEGYPVDVYGRRFKYDKKTGKIERRVK